MSIKIVNNTLNAIRTSQGVIKPGANVYEWKITDTLKNMQTNGFINIQNNK